ncbi:substrate-binding domain-containing protein, partial [Phytoactinopolyspora endophytica]|uniref:substrate-binding domain-containing protein n=1 Tax=Phytoactinopolyspora endophytica TaxID=1642495 RepID=UPI0013EE0F3F
MILVVLGLVAGGIYLVNELMGDDGRDPFSQGNEQGQGECDDARQVSIAAAPTIATMLEDIAENYVSDASGSAGEICVTVTAVPSAEAVENLGGDDTPDLWVPE